MAKRSLLSERPLYDCSPEDEQSCSKHVEDSNKHIIEDIVRQVGHLPELRTLISFIPYRD